MTLDQTQKGGDNSTNIQAGSVVIYQGPSITEVRDLALEVFRNNAATLAGEAANIARKRAEEITDDFLERLNAEHPAGLSQAKDPDFQYALLTAQKEYARCGDKELGDLLIDLLVDRSKQESRTILQIVLNESLQVAPKLTRDQLAVLTVTFHTKHTQSNAVNNLGSLCDLFDKNIKEAAGLISDKNPCYQHLEYAGCGAVGVMQATYAQCLRATYEGLFSRGFDETQFGGSQLQIAFTHPLIIPCTNDPTRKQINAMREDVIRSECKRYGVSDQDAEKLVALQKATLLDDLGVRKLVCDARPYMQRLFDIWDNSQMRLFTLTSVGIAIGHANIKKSVRDLTNLSIWIN